MTGYTQRSTATLLSQLCLSILCNPDSTPQSSPKNTPKFINSSIMVSCSALPESAVHYASLYFATSSSTSCRLSSKKRGIPSSSACAVSHNLKTESDPHKMLRHTTYRLIVSWQSGDVLPGLCRRQLCNRAGKARFPCLYESKRHHNSVVLEVQEEGKGTHLKGGDEDLGLLCTFWLQVCHRCHLKSCQSPSFQEPVDASMHGMIINTYSY